MAATTDTDTATTNTETATAATTDTDQLQLQRTETTETTADTTKIDSVIRRTRIEKKGSYLYACFLSFRDNSTEEVYAKVCCSPGYLAAGR